jgi:hypothetical protein
LATLLLCSIVKTVDLATLLFAAGSGDRGSPPDGLQDVVEELLRGRLVEVESDLGDRRQFFKPAVVKTSLATVV